MLATEGTIGFWVFQSRLAGDKFFKVQGYEKQISLLGIVHFIFNYMLTGIALTHSCKLQYDLTGMTATGKK
jgi:hypothetical protein